MKQSMANETIDTLKSDRTPSSPHSDLLTIIQPNNGWQLIDFKELSQYRDLFYFLVWRDIKALYAQTIMGFSWAIIQPLVQIVLFYDYFWENCEALY